MRPCLRKKKLRAIDGNTLHEPRASTCISTSVCSLTQIYENKTKQPAVVAYAHETEAEGLLQIQD